VTNGTTNEAEMAMQQGPVEVVFLTFPSDVPLG
jgi:hypothetical protein